MPVCRVCLKLDGEFAADVNVHRPAGAVRFGIIGMLARKILNGHKAVAKQPLIFAGKRFEELNDFVVNQQAIILELWSSPGKPRRRSNSAKVANSAAGFSILIESFLRYASSPASWSDTRKTVKCRCSLAFSADNSCFNKSMLTL